MNSKCIPKKNHSMGVSFMNKSVSKTLYSFLKATLWTGFSQPPMVEFLDTNALAWKYMLESMENCLIFALYKVLKFTLIVQMIIFWKPFVRFQNYCSAFALSFWPFWQNFEDSKMKALLDFHDNLGK